MLADIDRTPPPTAVDVYLARHPIYDGGNRRVAYEILYRATSVSTSAVGTLPEATMCSDTALHAVVAIGLDRLVGSVPAFINVGREHLVGDLYRVFDPKTVVLELLETIEPDQAVVDACARAARDGYPIALDDFEGKESWAPLLPYAQIIKVDVLNQTEDSLRDFLAPLKVYDHLQFLAERVETGAMRALCGKLGFTLYQGYYFSRPETLGGRALSLQQATVVQLLGLLSDPEASDRALEEAFRSHPSLSHALLRIVNSAAIGARDIDSIPFAIRMLGRSALSRWLLIMLVAGVASQSPIAHEAVQHALVRARFCELVTVSSGSGDPSARFLVGLLSQLDILMGQDMAQVLERLPVSGEVRDALLHRVGPHAQVLMLAEMYERAQWDAVDDMDPGSGAMLGECYVQATVWAAQRLSVSLPGSRR